MSTGVYAIAPGQMLGQYEIVAPLTSGGMAAVYLGRHKGPAGFARHVAIKVVHPRFADDPQFIEMFLDEARLSSRIEHANVVRVEALGNEHGLYYLVMEYIRGAPLHLFVRRLAEKKRILLPELVVHIMANVADGLHAAHETTDEQGRPLGIVHRDVTPQNVLISYAGAVKLIDFGIAKAAGRSHHTAKGALKGKLRYMAPEQAAGRAVDRRTDVYALGIVLWEMLTYKKLFSARTDAELMYMVRDPKIVSPRKLAPAVSEGLDAVVMQALSVSPDERFQTAQALRRALYEACPRARSIDAQELSVLVRGTMAGDIANEQRTLPPSVVSGPEVIAVVDAAREEAALTRIVPAVAPLDDNDAAPAPIPPPVLATIPEHAKPTVLSPGIFAATDGQSPYLPPAQPGYAQPGYAQPGHAQPGHAQPGQAQPATQPRTPAFQPDAAAPQPARLAAFTPPSPSLRSEVMAARPSPVETPRGRESSVASERLPETRSSRVGLFVVIAIAVVLTVAIGGIGGWYALHHATRLMQSP